MSTGNGGSIKVDMLGKIDSQGKEYFFTRPNMPCAMDLSKCVIFVHPFENDDGSAGAELIFRNYRARQDHGTVKKAG